MEFTIIEFRNGMKVLEPLSIVDAIKLYSETVWSIISFDRLTTEKDYSLEEIKDKLRLIIWEKFIINNI